MNIKDINSSIGDLIIEKKINAQISRINFDKWLEGEKLHEDPGNDYILKWIEEHGREFHEKFIESDCRSCKTCSTCGGSGKQDCENYSPEISDETKHILKKVVKLMIMNDVGTKTIKDVCLKYDISF